MGVNNKLTKGSREVSLPNFTFEQGKYHLNQLYWWFRRSF
jgi:hypothetical protein